MSAVSWYGIGGEGRGICTYGRGLFVCRGRLRSFVSGVGIVRMQGVRGGIVGTPERPPE